MTRFTETDKWKDPWFRGLSSDGKLVFLYIIENCNNAGFWEIDYDLIGFQTGLSITQVGGAIQGLARGLVVADGWVWARTFLKHQRNAILNPENNAHKQIIGLVKEQASRFRGKPEFDEFLGANQGLFSPIGNVKVKSSNLRKGSEEGKPMASETEVVEYVKSLGLPVGDGEFLYANWVAGGWKRNDKPIRDWKACARTWFKAGWLPSQKAAQTRGAAPKQEPQGKWAKAW